MTVDLSPVIGVMASLALAAVTAAIPIVVPYLVRLLHLQNNAAMVNLVSEAAKRAAGQAYDFMVTNQGVNHGAIRNAALASAAAYVARSVPDTLAKLGVTPEHVQAMVAGELGKLLAVDPTVSVALAPAAVRPAPIAAAAPATV